MFEAIHVMENKASDEVKFDSILTKTPVETLVESVGLA